MKKLLIFSALSFFALVPAAAAQPLTPWHFCQQASECMAVQSPCGSWAAINKKNQDAAEKYYAEQNKVVECIRFEDAPKPQNFSCEQGECRAE